MREELEDYGHVPSTERKASDMVDNYVRQVRVPGGRSRTVVVRNDLFASTINAFFGDRSVSKVTVQDCDAFLGAFVAGELTSRGRPVSRAYARRARSFLAPHSRTTFVGGWRPGTQRRLP